MDLPPQRPVERPGELGKRRAQEIREFLLERADQHPSDLVAVAVSTFGVSRQAVRKQLVRLERLGILAGQGRTRSRRYTLTIIEKHRVFPVHGLEEHAVWDEFVAPIIPSDVPKNVRDICGYGVTEMVNNVIDHSASATVLVGVQVTPKKIKIDVKDEGVGIFTKIHRELGLEDVRLAVFELSKGKLTTDPDRHSGEGIFFTSRMFDRFSILSGSLFFAHNRGSKDWLLDDRQDRGPGTFIGLEIGTMATHTDNEIFQQYASERDDYAFNKTHVVLELAKLGEERFVSRSQAKRVLARLERFREIGLDFSGIDTIGPAFADEIFRVFAAAHPEIKLLPYHASEEVERMIARALQHS